MKRCRCAYTVSRSADHGTAGLCPDHVGIDKVANCKLEFPQHLSGRNLASHNMFVMVMKARGAQTGSDGKEAMYSVADATQQRTERRGATVNK